MKLEGDTIKRLMLYAPNVHAGGGAVLLNSLVEAVKPEQRVIAWLDIRAREQYRPLSSWKIYWVTPSLSSRLLSEWQLRREAKRTDSLLCFHGLPPLFRSPATTTVFQQNRNYLGQVPLHQFSWRTRLRLMLEQIISRQFRGNVDIYRVQTISMAAALRVWWGIGNMPPVLVLGFAPPIATHSTPIEPNNKGERFDFLYVADGEAHKNHRRLIEAWILLATEGLRPSLALTLGAARDKSLHSWVQAQASQAGLVINFLDPMSHVELLELYSRCGALIFPSLGESYGLPLIEARAAGLPILASELDYVRDVCEPVQTFDPCSPSSISRAVKRHLGVAYLPPTPASVKDFLRSLLT